MYRFIGLVVSFSGIPILYHSVLKCLDNVCFSNPTTCIVTVFFRVTKVSALNVKWNDCTWTILMWELFPAPLSSLLTLVFNQ